MMIPKPFYVRLLIFLLENWKFVLALAAVAAIAGYIIYLKSAAGEERRRAQEAAAQQGQIRVDEAREQAVRASENINAVKNANYSNLSNEELRQKIINAARKMK